MRSENPRFIVLNPLHPQFRYREMINNFLWTELGGIIQNNVYFQQEGAANHISNETIAPLREKFPYRVL